MRMLALAAALALVMFRGTAVSHAQNISCSGTVGGGVAVTAINGNITVPKGTSCTLQFVDVTGDVS
jgi:hypothetical protein